MADTKTEKQEESMEEYVKKVPGKMTVLKVMPYKGCPVYLRRIGEDYFEYLLVFEGQIYADYFLFLPEKGKKVLTEKQVNGAAGIAFAAATATIDVLYQQKEERLMSSPAEDPKKKKQRNFVN